MSTSGEDAARAGRSDAGGGGLNGLGGLRGLAFRAGTVDFENSSAAWADKIGSPAAAPGKPPATEPAEPSAAESDVRQSRDRPATDMYAPPCIRTPRGAPTGQSMRAAIDRFRSLVTPQRASRWANSAFLAALCIFVAAAGWRFSRDYLSGPAEAIRPSAAVAEQQAPRPSQPAAPASERGPERIQERFRPETLDQQPVRRADAAPAADRKTTLSASAGAEPAPTRQTSAPARDDTAAPVRGAREAALASAAGEAGNVGPPAPSPAASPEADRLMERARLLLELGDIVTARVALERAVESGSPIAAFALAETYDPVVLSAWGAVGTRGDPAKAQQLYARAAAGGVETARYRLDASRQQPIRGEARR
jgi:hypothetical protein